MRITFDDFAGADFNLRAADRTCFANLVNELNVSEMAHAALGGGSTLTVGSMTGGWYTFTQLRPAPFAS